MLLNKKNKLNLAYKNNIIYLIKIKNMKYKFIPVNNDLKKAVAFANTLDNNFIKNTQNVKQKPFYIESLDAVDFLRKEGWQLKGVAEQRNKSWKINSHFLQLHHPDLSVLDNKGKTDSIASITVENSCNGNKPLNIHLGVFRLVCSNGAIRKETVAEQSIKHNELNKLSLESFINKINNKSQLMLNEINKLKQHTLTHEEIREFAYKAASKRYNKEELRDINLDDILKINRNEDEGNDVWTVFNRIQESLTHDIYNFKADIELNKQIYSLTEQYV